jgi:propanol-preferring alcohol dehydrogenase
MTANALVAAARLGAAARFVGPVGDDAAAAVFAAHFAREGVAADGLRASCAAGFTQCCETESTLIGWNRDGGCAEFVAVPEPCLLPVPDDIDDDLAPLLLDTTGTAAHGLRLVQRLLPPPSRTRVLVAGAGPVGLGGLIALRDAGFDDVAAADPRPARQQLALALGARAVHPVGERSPRFGLVVECSGQHAARDQALHIVAPHGVVSWVGESDEPWLVHETRAVRRKDFFLVRSSYFPKAEHARNIELLRRHAALYRQLIDHRCNVEELPATFARFAGGGHLEPLMMA